MMKALVRKAKRFVNVTRGQDFYSRVERGHATVRLGSDYGGWECLPQWLAADSIVYSSGVGEDVSFDVALIERFGLTVHAFDPTPRSIEWVKRQNLPANFVMHAVGIAGFDGDATFHPPENSEHISHTLLARPATAERAIRVPVQRLATLMHELGHERLDLLKMDIEGAEYEVIRDLVASRIRPAQVLVEFHHRFPNVGIAQTKAAVAQLREVGYDIFAISATGEEYGFIHCGACSP